MTIEVKKDSESKKFKIMVDYVQRGVLLSSALLANNEAQKIHDKETPFAELILA